MTKGFGHSSNGRLLEIRVVLTCHLSFIQS